MTPKSKIDFVDLNDDTKNNELTIRTTEHDFLPVCDKNFSNIHGIIKNKKPSSKVLSRLQKWLKT